VGERAIYLLSSRGGEIYCLDAKTGAQVYKAKADKVGACWASPWVNDDKIYFYDEKGITQLIQARKEFKVFSQNKINDKF
jgi:outer membrane protein assembly factor BamB